MALPNEYPHQTEGLMVPKEEEPGEDREQSLRFAFKYTMTGERRVWLTQQMWKVHPQKMAARVRVYNLLVIAIGVYCLFYLSVRELPIILLLCFGIFCSLYQLFFYRRMSMKRVKKLWNGKTEPAELVLDDRGCWNIGPNQKQLYYYSGFIDLCRCGEWYLLFVNESFALCLLRSGLTHGDPASLESFLEERTGRPVTVLEEAET